MRISSTLVLFLFVSVPLSWQGLDGGQSAASMLSAALQGMTTVTAFNMQTKLAKDYGNASEVRHSGMVRILEEGIAKDVAPTVCSGRWHKR